jgi:hypothetical protein
MRTLKKKGCGALAAEDLFLLQKVAAHLFFCFFFVLFTRAARWSLKRAETENENVRQVMNIRVNRHFIANQSPRTLPIARN